MIFPESLLYVRGENTRAADRKAFVEQGRVLRDILRAAGEMEPVVNVSGLMSRALSGRQVILCPSISSSEYDLIINKT